MEKLTLLARFQSLLSPVAADANGNGSLRRRWRSSRTTSWRSIGTPSTASSPCYSTSTKAPSAMGAAAATNGAPVTMLSCY
eukprot:6130654-Prymnesium_polylepis.1